MQIKIVADVSYVKCNSCIGSSTLIHIHPFKPQGLFVNFWAFLLISCLVKPSQIFKLVMRNLAQCYDAWPDCLFTKINLNKNLKYKFANKFLLKFVDLFTHKW